MFSGPTRVLLVEDDEEDYLITDDLLDEAPGEYLLTWVTSQDDALQALSESIFDVCLTDFRLGASTGLQLLSAARRENITVPFIMLTGLGDTETDRAAMEAGAADYLAKSGLTAAALDRSLRYARSQADLTRRLTYQAYHDLVTGSANRLQFHERLIETLSRARREGRVTALVFVDLDDFKAVNDSHGHATGDRLLRDVANRLRFATRDHDLVARFGGDEFAVCADLGPTNEIDSMELAERIVALIADPFDLDGVRVDITCSAGVAVDNGTDIDPETFTTHADIALYQAKRQGKNTVAVFEDEMHESLREMLELRSDYGAAIDRREFLLEYQPIVDVGTQEVVGFEGLCRWDHPTRGRLSPDRFIPMAESSGRIDVLGAYVLEQACGDAVRFCELTGQPLMITANVSPRQLTGAKMLETVKRAIATTEFDPERLVLEITESAMMADFELALSTLRSLKNFGVKIALDDFGSGFSSLNLLHRLPLDILKLDRLFVRDATTDPRAAAVVQSVTEMSRRIGVIPLAEGVETSTEHVFVKEAGFRLAQGYGYAKPAPFDQAVNLLDCAIGI